MIYVFGTGTDSQRLMKELRNKDCVVAFIDNYRSGNNYLGKHVIDLNEYLKKKDAPIVVATYRYADDITKQLDSCGLIKARDYYVWDDQNVYIRDESTKRFIEFNKKIWAKKRIVDAEGEILVPFFNRPAILMAIHSAYCGNYFAEKTHSKIVGYIHVGHECSKPSPVSREVYESINVSDIIDMRLTKQQILKSKSICDNVWKDINTWEDWNNITIEGIRFGTTIVRCILRYYIPSFEPNDSEMKKYLEESVRLIVFWKDYLKNHAVKTVLLCDGVCWDGYIRDIALSMNIPTYTIEYFFRKMKKDFHVCDQCLHYKEYWEMLPEQEQYEALNWAKYELDSRVSGKIDFIQTSNDTNSFAKKSTKRIFKNNRPKIMICPHIFEEDCYSCGEQIFDNNYIAWLIHLGELSKKITEYDWCIKQHPSMSKRDEMIMNRYLEKYKNIQLIPKDVNPHQLKKEGVKFALTVCGTIGYEYPLIGIDVITAGINPGSSFSYTFNPNTKEEFDKLIYNLNTLKTNEDKTELYESYAIHALYLDYHPFVPIDLFVKNKLLTLDPDGLQRKGLSMGTWMYDIYMDEWTEEYHLKLLQTVPKIFQHLDEMTYKDYVKKNVFVR